MTPYKSYMEKVALNAAMKRVGFEDVLKVDRSNPTKNFPQGIPRSQRSTSAVWKGDGTGEPKPLAEIDMVHRNIDGLPAPYRIHGASDNTAAVDWTHTSSFAAVRHGVPNITQKLLGRAAWQAKEDGMTHLMGDSGGAYTLQGKKHTDTTVANLPASVPVKYVKPHEYEPYSVEEGGMTTDSPVVNLHQLFAAKRLDRMTNRIEKSQSPVFDSLAQPRDGRDRTGRSKFNRSPV